MPQNSLIGNEFRIKVFAFQRLSIMPLNKPSINSCFTFSLLTSFPVLHRSNSLAPGGLMKEIERGKKMLTQFHDRVIKDLSAADFCVFTFSPVRAIGLDG